MRAGDVYSVPAHAECLPSGPPGQDACYVRMDRALLPGQLLAKHWVVFMINDGLQRANFALQLAGACLYSCHLSGGVDKQATLTGQ